MSLTSLFLAPAQTEASPALAELQRTLIDLEIIGEPLGPQTFLAGEGFSREVIYAGCSPFLVMTPPADGSLAFCHVALHGPFSSPQLVRGPNTVKPRCTACRTRVNHWRDWLADGWSGDHALPCDACQAPLTPCNVDWREHAVCARVMIELRNVYPGEATPSDRLLNALQDTTGMPWRYAWAAYLDSDTEAQPTTT